MQLWLICKYLEELEQKVKGALELKLKLVYIK